MVTLLLFILQIAARQAPAQKADSLARETLLVGLSEDLVPLFLLPDGVIILHLACGCLINVCLPH